MLRTTTWAAGVLGLLLATSIFTLAAPGKFAAYTDPAEAGPDFAVQGEYAGKLTTDSQQQNVGVQVIALGEGKFRAVLHWGGLPGAGWKTDTQKETCEGQTAEGATTFEGFGGKVVIRGGAMSIKNSGGDEVGKLAKVNRQSETMGAKPPEGAVVMLDGKSLDAFTGGGHLTSDGLLQMVVDPTPDDGRSARGDARTKESFGDFTLHLEFRSPFMPTALGQARGNSGLYLQNRYELQVLDSFGLSGENNECGGFYTLRKPDVNMCLPPLSWQTYDIDFTAPRFEDGKKVKNARVTVRHNGVAIHTDFEFPKVTPGGEKDEAATGPFKLQDHGNPVQYRNFWVVKRN
jgi:hypothetical protein